MTKRAGKIIAWAILFCVGFLLVAKIVSAPSKEETPSGILYLGNSKIFYNSLPEMVYQLSEMDHDADTKEEPYMTMTYGGRGLLEHAYALQGVYRCGGERGRLRETAKEDGIPYERYLQKGGVKEDAEETADPEIFDAYKKVLAGKYDYVVLLGFRDEMAFYDEEHPGYAVGAQAIMKLLQKSGAVDETVRIILVSAWHNLENLYAYQNTIDQNSEAVREKLYEAGYRNVEIAYSGRAFIDYFEQYDEDAEMKQNTFPAGIDNAVNDLFRTDRLHPTQLGTYLEACCVYQAMYGKTACGIDYDGLVPDAEHNPDAGRECRTFNYRALSYGINEAYEGITDRNTIEKLQNCAAQAQEEAVR